MKPDSGSNATGRQDGQTDRASRLLTLGISGSLLAASGSVAADAAPAKGAPSEMRDRIAMIKQRLADPVAASKLAGRLRIDREGELLTFANFNNWDNGWDNQGFNNY